MQNSWIVNQDHWKIILLSWWKYIVVQFQISISIFLIISTYDESFTGKIYGKISLNHDKNYSLHFELYLILELVWENFLDYLGFFQITTFMIFTNPGLDYSPIFWADVSVLMFHAFWNSTEIVSTKAVKQIKLAILRCIVFWMFLLICIENDVESVLIASYKNYDQS